MSHSLPPPANVRAALAALLCTASAAFAAAASAPRPEPHQVVIGEILPDNAADAWSEVEGTVTAATVHDGKLALELSAGTGRINVTVDERGDFSPALLMHAQLRATGVCHPTYTVDGHRIAGALTVPTVSDLQLVNIAPTLWSEYPVTDIGRVIAGDAGSARGDALVHVRGTVRAATSDGAWQLADETGQIRVVTSEPSAPATGAEIELLATRAATPTGMVLRHGFLRPAPLSHAGAIETLPVLTAAEQVHQLSRRELSRGYPAHLRGVVTRVIPANRAIILQDFTRGIYVDHLTSNVTPQVGDYWEIEGTTDPGEYSPFVHATFDRRRGAGYLPSPAHPSWDQMLNGSMHCQYVEVEGVVIATAANKLTLFTRAGKFTITLDDIAGPALQRYENAVVRIRGSLFNRWDPATGRVRMGEFYIGATTVLVDQEAPADLFAGPPKRVAELLEFDPHAGSFQRVKVRGQVVHAGSEPLCLMDGNNGLRFNLVNPTPLAAGDLVEVVGFPEWSGPSPMLQEAVVRTTGHAPLPVPHHLAPSHLLAEENDATRVTVEADLLRVSRESTGPVLELQAGFHRFLARLPPDQGLPEAISAGSKLAVTGVYVGLGGQRTVGRPIGTFELRVASPADLHVIARPPWWSLTRLLALVGFLFGVLVLAFVWITLLRRQVEDRAEQLEAEIGARQRIEQERALEQERARVARDLHDELGSGLTEVGLLDSLAPTPGIAGEKKEDYLAQLTDKTRGLVTTLDEIVWAVNPRYDSVTSVATYFSLYAHRFLALASIGCRLQIAPRLPDHLMNSKLRHELFLAFKETLNNVVRHAHATDVELTVAVDEGRLVMAVADNGRGLSAAAPADGSDGLGNIVERIRALGGECRVTSAPGRGTTVRFILPLP